MKQLFLMLCAFFALSTTTTAQELFKCTDTDGSTILTTSPQDGMKCTRGEGANDEPKRSKISSTTNLLDKCSNFSRELEDVTDDITALEKRRSELQREQLDNRQSEPPSNSSYRSRSGRTHPVNEKMNKLNNELSVLYQKKSLINQDIRLYKCNELNNDLSKLNQNKPEKNTGGRYRNR